MLNNILDGIAVIVFAGIVLFMLYVLGYASFQIITSDQWYWIFLVILVCIPMLMGVGLLVKMGFKKLKQCLIK
ncbi:MAG: hypothetical protein WC389_12815 [Lutibacter sp.]